MVWAEYDPNFPVSRPESPVWTSMLETYHRLQQRPALTECREFHQRQEAQQQRREAQQQRRETQQSPQETQQQRQETQQSPQDGRQPEPAQPSVPLNPKPAGVKKRPAPSSKAVSSHPDNDGGAGAPKRKRPYVRRQLPQVHGVPQGSRGSQTSQLPYSRPVRHTHTVYNSQYVNPSQSPVGYHTDYVPTTHLNNPSAVYHPGLNVNLTLGSSGDTYTVSSGPGQNPAIGPGMNMPGVSPRYASPTFASYGVSIGATGSPLRPTVHVTNNITGVVDNSFNISSPDAYVNAPGPTYNMPGIGFQINTPVPSSEMPTNRLRGCNNG